MMKKIITGLAIAATSLMVSIGTPSFNFVTGETIMTAEASDKVLSMEEAAEKIIKASYKAYKQKKKVSTTVTIKCPVKKSVAKNKSKLQEAIVKWERKLVQAVAEKELGELNDDEYLVRRVWNLVCPSGESYIDSDGWTFWDICYKETYKNGKLTLANTYLGYAEEWRESWDNIIYGKQNTEELRELVNGMSEVEKACRVATWLMYDHAVEYDPDSEFDSERYQVPEEYIAKNRAGGNSACLCEMYNRYATRVGLTAFLIGDFSAVGIGDEIYILDMLTFKKQYERWINDISHGRTSEMPRAESFMRDLTLDKIETAPYGSICIKEWKIVTDSKKYEKIYEEAVKNHQCPIDEDDDWGTVGLIYEDEYEG